MKSLLLRIAILLNVSLSLSLGSYFLSGTSQPLLLPVADSFIFEKISVEQAWERIQERSAAVIDARTPDLFRSGHVPEAISIPVGSEPDPGVITRLSGVSLVIVYCDGAACGASREIAQQLAKHGVRNVAIMEAGWNGWLNAALPVVLGL